MAAHHRADLRGRLVDHVLWRLRQDLATRLGVGVDRVELALWVVHPFRRDLSLVGRVPWAEGLDEPYVVYSGAGHAGLICSHVGREPVVLHLPATVQSTRSASVNTIRGNEETWIVGVPPPPLQGLGSQAALYVMVQRVPADGAIASSAILDVVGPELSVVRAAVDAQWPDYPTPEGSGIAPANRIARLAEWIVEGAGLSQARQFGVGLVAAFTNQGKGAYMTLTPDPAWHAVRRGEVLERAIFPMSGARAFVEGLAAPPPGSPKTGFFALIRKKGATSAAPPIFTELETEPEDDVEVDVEVDVGFCGDSVAKWLVRIDLAAGPNAKARADTFAKAVQAACCPLATGVTAWVDRVETLYTEGRSVEADDLMRFGARFLTARLASTAPLDPAVAARLDSAWQALGPASGVDTGMKPMSTQFESFVESIRIASKEADVAPLEATFWARGTGLCVDTTTGSSGECVEAITVWPPLPEPAPDARFKFDWDIASRRDMLALARLLSHLKATASGADARVFEVERIQDEGAKLGFDAIQVEDGGTHLLHVLWRDDLWDQLERGRNSAKSALFKIDADHTLVTWAVTSRPLTAEEFDAALANAEAEAEAWKTPAAWESGDWILVTRWVPWDKLWPVATQILDYEALKKEPTRRNREVLLGPAREAKDWPQRTFCVRLKNTRKDWKITDRFARAANWVLFEPFGDADSNSAAQFVRKTLLSDLSQYLPDDDQALRKFAKPYLQLLVDLCVSPASEGPSPNVVAGAVSPGAQTRARCVLFLPFWQDGEVAGVVGLLTSAPRSRRGAQMAFGRGTLERRWADEIVHAASGESGPNVVTAPYEGPSPGKGAGLGGATESLNVDGPGNTLPPAPTCSEPAGSTVHGAILVYTNHAIWWCGQQVKLTAGTAAFNFLLELANKVGTTKTVKLSHYLYLRMVRDELQAAQETAGWNNERLAAEIGAVLNKLSPYRTIVRKGPSGMEYELCVPIHQVKKTDH